MKKSIVEVSQVLHLRNFNYLNSQKRLPPDVWKMWMNGMKLFAKIQELQIVWCVSSQLYNDNFCTFFNNLIKEVKSKQLTK